MPWLMWRCSALVLLGAVAGAAIATGHVVAGALAAVAAVVCLASTIRTDRRASQGLPTSAPRPVRGHATAVAPPVAEEPQPAVVLAVEDELRRTEDVRAQLLAVVSHEFRTPLTGILGYARTLQAPRGGRPVPPDLVALAAGRIERNSRRLERLVDNMLASASEVVPTRSAVLPLADVVNRTTADLLAAADGPPAVTQDVPDDLVVHVAAEHVRLVVQNLVDNAVKFADPGTEVVVRARGVGGAVTLTVTDTGPPVPAAMADRILAPFVQMDSSDSRGHEGAGLGLHVVRRICAAYGGELELLCQDRTVVMAATLPGGSAAERTLTLSEASIERSEAPVDAPAGRC